MENNGASLIDIIAVQAIICVIIGIGFVTLNLLRPDISAELREVYTRHAAEERGSISEFFNSTPAKTAGITLTEDD